MLGLEFIYKVIVKFLLVRVEILVEMDWGLLDIVLIIIIGFFLLLFVIIV